MSKSDTHENGYLNLLYKNVDLANIGDATGLRGATTAGSFYIALFTVAPTDSTSGTECAYGGYARKAVARGAGFNVTGNQASNASAVTFDTVTSGSETIVAFAVMTASSGGTIVHYATLTSSVAVVTDDIPKFEAGDLTITEN